MDWTHALLPEGSANQKPKLQRLAMYISPIVNPSLQVSVTSKSDGRKIRKNASSLYVAARRA
jgi:hypothetical protein